MEFELVELLKKTRKSMFEKIEEKVIEVSKGFREPNNEELKKMVKEYHELYCALLNV